MTNGEGRSAPPRPAPEPRTADGTSPEQRSAPGLPLRPFAPPRPGTPAPRPGAAEPRVAPPSGPGAAERPARPPVPPRPSTFHPSARRTGAPWETPSETTTRLRPVPADPPAAPSTPRRPDIRLSGSAESFTDPDPHVTEPPDPAHRPFVSLAAPDTFDNDTVQPHTGGTRRRPRLAAVVTCVVLGLGLIGGAVTGSWLSGDSDGGAGTPDVFTAAGALWHSIPVDELFPPTVDGEGAGPGGADRAWTRIAVAPDSGCKDAFDPLLRKALAPAGCLRLLRATYTDATRSHVTTVGLLFTKADSAAMGTLRARFNAQGLDRRRDLMPRPYAAQGTLAAGFGDAQRASWTVSVLTDAPVVVYAVSGFADGRSFTEPQPAEDAMKADATTPAAQGGLGHDAQGLADRIERSLRKTVNSATEKPS
ncbi:hypothetical protein QF035_008280 [Streptomyces umbrinus]|uniref:Uncharacterized protein n=1 Tax=Streptomyces umbrinus TaxID=67370 RepID=A0ABU0T4T8_9ACTN|nr:hypothetical protein [Streptomyces umbrinus]MDQ1030698.1 hypothetical protein [Streptomyces umbrinus]